MHTGGDDAGELVASDPSRGLVEVPAVTTKTERRYRCETCNTAWSEEG